MTEQVGQFYNTLPEGVGAALSVNATTRSMSKFFNELRNNLGIPIPTDAVHVTAIDATETAIPIQSERDLIALRHAGDKIHRRLAALPLQEMQLHPCSDDLESVGRYLAIPLHVTPFMEELRGSLAEIVKEELDVTIDPEIAWHMSVVQTTRTRVRTRDHIPQFPPNIRVNGFTVERRVMDGGNSRDKRPGYKNKSKQLRMGH